MLETLRQITSVRTMLVNTFHPMNTRGVLNDFLLIPLLVLTSTNLPKRVPKLSIQSQSANFNNALFEHMF